MENVSSGKFTVREQPTRSNLIVSFGIFTNMEMRWNIAEPGSIVSV